jgi:hypothetical protein
MGHAHSAPELPDVTDEAPNTPKWVPFLGAALFLLAVVGIVVSHGAHGAGDAADTAQAE